MKFQKFKLEHGVTVVCEHHPYSQSLCIGYWVPRGTRHEDPKKIGISHFLEHLVFKGTKTKSAFDIAKYLECVGGDLNAFTSRENTCFHALVLESDWKRAVHVLSDLVTNMSVKKSDFNLEKKVVLQEIAMVEDQSEEYLFDKFLEHSLEGHPLSWPILGTEKTVGRFTQGDLRQYYRDHYAADNMLISFAGKFDVDKMIPELTKSLRGLAKKGRQVAPEIPPIWNTADVYLEKDLEQVQIVMGFPVTSFRDKERFHAFILNAILGGGMTSRLYQAVRERKGLAYSIYSNLNTFVDFGFISISAATQPAHLGKLLEVIRHELNHVRRYGIKKSELELYKRQLRGNILLGSDDLDSRMNSLAINEMIFGEYRSPQEVIKGIESITLKEMNQFIKKYLTYDQFSRMALGPKSAQAQKVWKDWSLA